MLASYRKLLNEISNLKPQVKQFIAHQKKKKTAGFDVMMHTANDVAFSKIDCLQCANCCKTTSPLLTNVDIDRLSKGLRVKPAFFLSKYTTIDEDGDTVMNQSPCPFLAEDNFCSVYEFRPIACRDYPHMKRKNMISYLGLAEKNVSICPAVADVFQQLMKFEK